MRQYLPRSASLAGAALIAVAVAVAPAPAHADGPRLTLEQLTAKAQAGPRAKMARGDTDAAGARVSEVGSALFPRVTATAFAGPSPKITCNDPGCDTTDPDGFSWSVDGLWTGVSLDVVQPIYAYNKAGPARRASRAGVAAMRALEDESAGDVAVEAARAYWGLKLARELRYMLEDGIEQLDKAHERLVERVAEGTGEVTIQDQQRLETIIAEANIQLQDASQGEEIALAAVRALAGDDRADIDEEPIDAIAYELLPEAEYFGRAGKHRPQVIAAAEGARAAQALADLEASEYFPLLTLNGSLIYSDAAGVQDTHDVIHDDPYHRSRASLLLTLTWKIEPWTTRTRVARARAAASRASAQADLALMGATLDQRMAYAEAARSKRRVDVATAGENSARAWVASLVQADAIGTAEPKDLAEAYLGWFGMRARLANAIQQWNVATVKLERAAGGYKAPR
jgi:outer membrane protein TolC